METERSDQVVSAFKQEKVNVSVYARIQQLLNRFEAEYQADRSLARIGAVIAVVLLAILVFIFLGGSEIRVS